MRASICETARHDATTADCTRQDHVKCASCGQCYTCVGLRMLLTRIQPRTEEELSMPGPSRSVLHSGGGDEQGGESKG